MIKRVIGSIFSVAMLSLLGACALLPGRSEPLATVVQSSQYCGTDTPDAELHYFTAPQPFSAWISQRDIRDLRGGAASLTGVLVVEMGQRPSEGYNFEIIPQSTRVENNTLVLAMQWNGPGIDDHVAQVIISPCVVIPRPKGEYDEVVLVDQRGEQRAQLTLP